MVVAWGEKDEIVGLDLTALVGIVEDLDTTFESVECLEFFVVMDEVER
jgi:hypothetical protein